ncbi:hypothetical protein AAW12_23060 [Sphingobacterium sp. Ag1]|uniref:hypothetical protein n=1 Tax=Sphingobacterium sp. Ag1 TaxID=1643451 RepID=UPI00062762DE|nr:hypothetical protein [Sphingobacterium sp. Ag1]KKO89047.1 hypothetical protein AAW12_23060 [Sphingobacterium sp. Ag1]
MKRIYIFLMLLLSSSLSFGQGGEIIYKDGGIIFSYSYKRAGTYKSKDYMGSSGYGTCEQQINIFYVTVKVKNNTPELATFRDSYIEIIGSDYKAPDCKQITRTYNGWPMVFPSNPTATFMDLGAGREYQNTIECITVGKDEPYVGKSTRIERGERPYVKPEWGEWKTFTGTDCNTNILYKVLHGGNGWGGQTDFFEVKSNNDRTVSFVFQLLDANGRVHFGDTHTVNPGETIKFEHKMQNNVRITSYRLDKLIYVSTGKPVCGTSQEEELLSLKKRRYELCQELSTVLGNRQNAVFDKICRNLNKSYAENDINQLKNEVNELEQELRYQKGVAPQRETQQDLEKQRNELCNELSALVQKSGKPSQVNEDLCLSGVHLPGSLQQDINTLKTEIARLKTLDREEEKQNDEQLLKQQEEQRRAEEQQNRFDNYITQGDKAYADGNYDSAMSLYSEAQNIALNDTQKQTASEKYNRAYEAKRTAARQERLAVQEKRDANEDLAYTSLASGTIGIMSLINDQYTNKVSSGKVQVGLGYEQMPIITNQNNSYSAPASYADKTSYPLVYFGLNLEFLNNKPVNLHVRPLVSIGINAFSKGTSGTHTATGIEGGIRFWYKSQTRFKFFADFGWYNRVGDKTADKDAQSGGATTTDEVREGKYSYHVLRYGGGPMLHWRHHGRESWLKPGIYFEQFTFAKHHKPTMSFGLSANIESEIILEGTYSKNYPVAGNLQYPNAFTFANQDYFSIKIIRQGKLW